MDHAGKKQLATLILGLLVPVLASAAANEPKTDLAKTDLKTIGRANRVLQGEIADLGRLMALQEAMKADLDAIRPPAPGVPGVARPLRDNRLRSDVCPRLLPGDLCDDLSATFARR